MAKLLFVSKDIGGTKMLVPIASEAKNRGHKIYVVAEGNGAFLWPRADMISFAVSSLEFLKTIQPDAVLMEFPFSANFAKNIGIQANQLDIPIILVEDYWGVCRRLSEVRLGLVLTIDEYAKKIAMETVGRNIPVEVIGNHAVANIEKYPPPAEVLEILSVARRRFQEIFIYVGGNVVEADLRLLVSSLLCTPGNWGLIPCYHPNYRDCVDRSSGKKCSEVWNAMLDPIADRVVRCDSITSDSLAVLGDACFSAFGSSVSTAIRAGKPVVILSTPESDTALKRVNLEEVPWLALGAAGMIRTPQNIRPFLVPPSKEVRNKFMPLNPFIAVNSIEDFLLSVRQ